MSDMGILANDAGGSNAALQREAAQTSDGSVALPFSCAVYFS
jgi:hypothetical protein